MARTAPTITRHPDAKNANRFWGQAPLPARKVEFFNAVTTPPSSDGTGSVATIRMYGPVDSWGGFWGISAKDVGAVLDALPDTVDRIVLRINSPGGEVWEGMAILNMLRAHAATVTAVVDGIAASAASFIAAGCDETVMSPGTQLMIHSPWSFAFGNAADMRKTADTLDSISRAITEIYTGKAGEKDWAALLDEETWMTATESVEFGLADRVAVIPDAGESATVGDDNDPDLVVLPDEDEPEDSAAARVIRIVARTPRAHTPHPTSRVSPEPGTTDRKDDAVTYSDLQAGIRTRLGITDAGASDETLLAALDESLAEQADTITPPAGTSLIDSAVLASLQADAAQGREAREEQNRARRTGIVDNALREGRIAPASRDQWLASLDRDEQGTTALLGTLPRNTALSTIEVGHSDEPSADDSLYAAAWGKDDKETQR